MKSIIVAGGCINNYDYFKNKITDGDYIICVDGGMSHCIKMGIVPDMWVGDFDSVNYCEICTQYPYLSKVDTVSLNPQKDETDTHKACIIASEKGFTDIVIWGALGKRADHMIGNIHLLELLHKNNINAKIEDETNLISVFSGKKIFYPIKKYISLIPIDKSVFVNYAVGLLYPISNYTMHRELTLGISNEIKSEYAEISVSDGIMLVIQSDD